MDTSPLQLYSWGNDVHDDGGGEADGPHDSERPTWWQQTVCSSTADGDLWDRKARSSAAEVTLFGSGQPALRQPTVRSLVADKMPFDMQTAWLSKWDITLWQPSVHNDWCHTKGMLNERFERMQRPNCVDVLALDASKSSIPNNGTKRTCQLYFINSNNHTNYVYHL